MNNPYNVADREKEIYFSIIFIFSLEEHSITRGNKVLTRKMV